MKAEDFYLKNYGNATSVPKESVIELLKTFAKALQIERSKSDRTAETPTLEDSFLETYWTERLLTYDKASELAEDIVRALKTAQIQGCQWIEYIRNHDSNPRSYGKYLVHRKDGKIHWETWNGIGFAYNDNVITHWHYISPPSS
jgi:hypothetical protein